MSQTGENEQGLRKIVDLTRFTSIFILMLVIVATAKSALDELSDVSLRLLASAEYADRPSSIPSSTDIHAGGRPPHADNPQPPKHGEHQA